MIDKLFGKKKPQRSEKAVSAKQYNELIDYYTREINSLKKEISRVKEQNLLLMNTSVKQSEKAKLLEERNIALARENNDLKLKNNN